MTVKYTGSGIADNTDETKVMGFDVSGVTTSTTRTLTMPDRDVTIGNAGDLTGALPAGMGGKVLQVIQDTDVTEASSTSATLADTGLTATITPSSASNKILVLVSQTGCAKYGGSSNNSRLKVVLLKDSTQIALIEDRMGYNNSTQYNWVGTASINYLDSPNTTSAVTYKTQFSRQSGDGTVRINDDNSVSTITLMEIEG